MHRPLVHSGARTSSLVVAALILVVSARAQCPVGFTIQPVSGVFPPNACCANTSDFGCGPKVTGPSYCWTSDFTGTAMFSYFSSGPVPGFGEPVLSVTVWRNVGLPFLQLVSCHGEAQVVAGQDYEIRFCDDASPIPDDPCCHPEIAEAFNGNLVIGRAGDTCAFPRSAQLVGSGPIPFDNTASNSEGVPSACLSVATFERDQWIRLANDAGPRRWTLAIDVNSGADALLSLHADALCGPVLPPTIACVGVPGGTRGHLVFDALANEQFLLRIGSPPGGAPTSGTLRACSQLLPPLTGDCDADGIPDGCQVLLGFAADCNSSQIPDACEFGPADCDNDGVSDGCELAAGAPDCNGNAVPDDCDVAQGTSSDCNGDTLPDECQPALAITTQPSDQFVSTTQTATFTAGATGLPPLTYRWTRSGQDLVDGAGVSGAATPTLTLTPATAVGTGEYALRVTDGCGVSLASAPALLEFLVTTFCTGDTTTLWTWEEVGGGLPGNSPNITARALSGAAQTGSYLHVAGDIPSLGNVARFTGGTWQTVGGGLDDVCRALLFVEPAGSSPSLPNGLYVGGDFTQPGPMGARYVARIAPAGTAWLQLNGVLDGPVHALTSLLYPGPGLGGGPVLVVGGAFQSSSGTTLNGVAFHDGAQWRAFAGGLPGGTVHAVAEIDLGSGPRLFAAGAFPGRIQQWNGTSWSSVGVPGFDGPVLALARYDHDGAGPAPALLVAGGDFNLPFPGVAAFDGTQWIGLDGGCAGIVRTLQVLPTGVSGRPVLFAGGTFVSAGQVGYVETANLAAWNGRSWSSAGLDSATGGGRDVHALAAHLEAPTPARPMRLVVGGRFRDFGDVPADRVAELAELSATACPCENWGWSTHGCANSVHASGARLSASGTVTGDALVLYSVLAPSSATVTFWKSNQRNDVATVFGDGRFCLTGALIRIRTKTSVLGRASYPDPGEIGLGVRGQTPPGSGLTAYYQTSYRNASLTFCTPATYNVTNGLVVTW